MAKPKWRLLLYMSGDTLLQDDMVTDLCELFKGRAALLTRFDDVFVQCGLGPQGGGFVPVKDGKKRFERSWKGIRRFRLGEEKEFSPSLGKKVKKVNGKDQIMTDPVTLAQFLLWGRGDLPTMLILWGHGAGFATVLSWKEVTMDDPRILGSLADEAHPNSVSVAQLIPYLEGKFGVAPRKLDILGFDSCFMASLEVIYEFRNYADYVTASQELTPGAGWNYARWPKLKWLDPRGLCSAIVKDYDARSSLTRTLSVTSTDAIEDVKDALDEFEKLSQKFDSRTWQALKRIRQECAEYGEREPPEYSLRTIDVRHFFEAVSKSNLSLATRNAARQVVIASKAAVIESQHGTDRGGRFGSNGLSIFFPKSRKDFNVSRGGELYKPGGRLTTAFARESKWLPFLESFWGKNP